MAELSIREALKSAMEGGGDEEDTESTPAEPADEGLAKLDADFASGEKEPTPSAEPAAEAPKTEAAPRQRDATGKFAKTETAKTASPKKGATTQVAPHVPAAKPNNTPAPQAATQSATPPPAIKPPPGWTPAAREHWAKLPAPVQQEVAKRERETAQALNESTTARKFHQDFSQTISAYQPLIQSAGGDPMAVTKSLFQAMHTLQYGSQQQRAAVVSHMIRSFGVDLPTLDSALTGQSAPQSQAQSMAIDPNQLAAMAEQRVLERLQGQRAEQLSAKADSDVQAFFSQEPEFYEDVKDDMADMLELYAKRGKPLSLEQAYQRAISQNDEISAILKQREESQQANVLQASTQRARAAASSVKSQPAGPQASGSQPNDIRSALRAAMAAHSGR